MSVEDVPVRHAVSRAHFRGATSSVADLLLPYPKS
jgi:hypothetical protein